MKNVITLLASMLLTTSFAVGQVERSDVVGLWLSEEKDGKVEIFEKADGTFAGCTRWIIFNGEENPPVKDEMNPEVTKRDRPIVGMEIMYGFEFKKDSWINGRIYDPRTGNTYRAKMKLKENDKNTLLFRGHLGVPMMGKTTTWTRITE